jgi:uncharacterized protein (TIGR03118 family)
MNDTPSAQVCSADELVGRITDEFLERLGRGERPQVEDYARRYPEVASVIRQVFPTLELMRGSPIELGLPDGWADPLPPTGCLGDFKILREVGRGGMGVVYEAEQVSLGRRVALKVLPLGAAMNPKQLQRFQLEAHAAACLHHTNTVPVHAVGCERGVPFYAMQYIEGPSLAQLIAELRRLDGLSADDGPKTAPANVSAANLAALLTTGRFAPPSPPPGHRHGYTLVGLISDVPGAASVIDPALSGTWGFAYSPEGPLFLVNANSGLATTYRIDGRTDRVQKVAPDIAVPSMAPFPFGGPTGVVYNDTDKFLIGVGSKRGPAKYITAVLDGTLAAWRPGLPSAITVADNSHNALAYTGVALAHNKAGHFLIAANCAQARIDVYDENFNLSSVPGGFKNPAVPGYYMPFNVQNIRGKLYVAYAVFNPNTMEEETDPGKGIIAVFNTDGELIQNIGIGTDAGGPLSQLNAPCGFAFAPENFGRFSGALLSGNLGDGAINAFNPCTYEFLGQLTDPTGQVIKIDGLWALGEGNGERAGSEDKLYFAASPDSDSHGLFGYIRAQ